MTTTNPDTDRPLRGRRLSPAEFFKLTGRKLRAANDNEKATELPRPPDIKRSAEQA